MDQVSNVLINQKDLLVHYVEECVIYLIYFHHLELRVVVVLFTI
jgi:hypothetical protein